MPPAWKPAYLIHGDDHGRLAERRAKLREVAEAQSGANGAEVLEGDDATPEAAAMALSAMTFAMGRRFVIVDGAEGWKEADVADQLAAVIASLDPDTTVVFFAREDGRLKAPKALHDAVRKAGGDIACESALKPKELPHWVQGEAKKLGVNIDHTAAQALVAAVGERQQRLLRELETLALEHGRDASISLDDVEAVAAHSSERKVFALADALLARDHGAATRFYLELRDQGEALERLVPLAARRLREVLGVAERLEAGESPAQVKGTLKMPPWMADRRVSEARRSDVDRLRRGLEALADLELATRGGQELRPDTVALRAIEAIAA